MNNNYDYNYQRAATVALPIGLRGLSLRGAGPGQRSRRGSPFGRWDVRQQRQQREQQRERWGARLGSFSGWRQQQQRWQRRGREFAQQFVGSVVGSGGTRRSFSGRWPPCRRLATVSVVDSLIVFFLFSRTSGPPGSSLLSFIHHFLLYLVGPYFTFFCGYF